MAGREHELHQRRLSRNVGTGLVLAAFAIILLGLTMAKLASLPPPSTTTTVSQ